MGQKNLALPCAKTSYRLICERIVALHAQSFCIIVKFQFYLLHSKVDSRGQHRQTNHCTCFEICPQLTIARKSISALTSVMTHSLFARLNILNLHFACYAVAQLIPKFISAYVLRLCRLPRHLLSSQCPGSNFWGAGSDFFWSSKLANFYTSFQRRLTSSNRLQESRPDKDRLRVIDPTRCIYSRKWHYRTHPYRGARKTYSFWFLVSDLSQSIGSLRILILILRLRTRINPNPGPCTYSVPRSLYCKQKTLLDPLEPLVLLDPL